RANPCGITWRHAGASMGPRSSTAESLAPTLDAILEELASMGPRSSTAESYAITIEGKAVPGASMGPRSSTAESPRCKPSTPRKTRRFNGAAVIDRGKRPVQELLIEVSACFNGAAVIDRGKPPVQIQCGFGVLATGLRARRDGGVESAVAWMCTGGRVVYLCWVFKE